MSIDPRRRRAPSRAPGLRFSAGATLATQSCWGESTAVDDACYHDTAQDYVTTDTDVITRGWLDAAHHVSLSRTTPLTPGAWYTITVPLDTTDAVFARGHQVGLVVTASDEENTSPTSTGATITIDPTRSSLALPLVWSTRRSEVPAGVRKPGRPAGHLVRQGARAAHRIAVPTT